MRIHRLLPALLTLSLGLGLAGGDALAAGKAAKRQVRKGEEPAQVETPIAVESVTFGMDPKAAIATYEKVIEKDFQVEFAKVEPGTEMRRLEERMENEKDYVRKSLLTLDAPPTTLDGTKYVGEFTYGNQESVLRVDRAGKKRTLFFIRNRLWKVIDVYAYGPKAKWGTNFAAAIEKLEELTEVEGRKLAKGGKEARAFEERDWADEKTHLRAIDWGKELAVAYVDRATEAQLGELRTAKEKAKEDLDPAVKDVLRR